MTTGNQAEEIAEHIDLEHPGRAAEEVQVAIGMIADALVRISETLDKIEKHLDEISDAAEIYKEIHPL